MAAVQITQDSLTTVSLNATKFLPPLSSRGGIVRARQLDFMEQNPQAQVVLLLAPAGYGKTTLMGQWMERVHREGEHTSWLTLDAADNDPARLMSYLYGAMREWLAAALGHGELAALGRGDWMSLLDRVAPDAPPLTLFLDEFEQITAPSALHAAKQLINRLPRLVRLVIGSREKPLLGLERYRVRGELLELTAANLSFDTNETQLFFTRRIAEPLAAWAIERMQSVTEGWPAALQLTALAARSRTDLERYAADLSGSLVHIADYLAEDVLNAQGEEVRAFLLETCSFPRLNAAACDAATGRTDSRRILQHLERHGLFTIALDTGRKWYRYHPLFAEFLRGQQQQVLPRSQIVATHRGAARWFARYGTAMEAVDLWLLAGDSEAAADQMAGCARELVTQAQFGTVQRWLERLDAQTIEKAGPELLLGAAWASAFNGTPENALVWLERLRRSVAARNEQELWNDEVIAFEVVLQALCNDVPTSLARGLEHWERIGTQCSFAAGAVANTVSYGLMLNGDFARARYFSDKARTYNAEIGSALGLGYAIAIAGFIAAMQGNLEEALDETRTIDKLTTAKLRQTWFESTHIRLSFVGLLAGIRYERDQLDEADELLQHYLPLGVQQPSLDMLLFTHIVGARLKVAQGDFVSAMSALDETSRNAAAQSMDAYYALEHERVHIELIAGRYEQALARAETIERLEIGQPNYSGVSFTGEICGHGIEIVRVAILRRQIDAALKRVDAEIAAADAGGRRWRLLKLRLLRALALDARGDKPAAQEELLRALQLGHSIGARRSFAEECQRLEEMVAEFPCSLFANADDALALKRYWMDLRGEVPALAASPDEGGDGLSERERSILKLLATGMGNEQIATSLSLSVNTVKWHIRRILEKLQARNRSEAVFIANRRGLVA